MILILNKSIRRMVIFFLLPATLLYIFLFLYPTIRAFYVSLFDWSGFTTQMQYVGLGNFLELFHEGHFWKIVMVNTLRIIFIGGLIIFGLSFVLSGVLTTDIKGKKFFRGLLFFPAVINPVAIAILWGFIYNENWGLLNNILGALGLDSLQMTWNGPGLQPWTVLVALIWMYTGFFSVILLAALDRVPPGLIEAAKLEGASELVIFFKIKIPLIMDVLVTSFILWGIMAVKEFPILYAWSGGIDVPPDGTQNLAVYMYITAFGRRVSIFRMGYSTAMGVIMFLMVVLLVLVISFATRNRESIEY